MSLLLMLLPAVRLDDDHMVLAAFGIRHALILVVVRHLGDDVPSVKKTRNVCKHAKKDVDEAIGGTHAAFDPHG